MTPALFMADGVAKSFPDERGAPRAVLSGVGLSLRRGEVLALLGPSGCGKSTLLNILAGFVPSDAGRVLLEGRPCAAPGPERAVVFQEDALFPWLTARENVELGLRAAGTGAAEARRTADGMLDMVGLAGCGGQLPAALSGGMRQRVALVRALAVRPKVLLMDEPFAALDAMTRDQMHDVLVDLHAATGVTIVFVTHDVAEAAFLADTVAVMGWSGNAGDTGGGDAPAHQGGADIVARVHPPSPRVRGPEARRSETCDALRDILRRHA